MGAFDGGVGADHPAAFAVGAVLCTSAFFGAACAGFGFRVGLVVGEPVFGGFAFEAAGDLFAGESNVLVAPGVFDGAVCSGCWFVACLLLGVSGSERIQVVVVGVGRFGLARGIGGDAVSYTHLTLPTKRIV